MNKLLALTNMELKRNSKFYLVYLSILSAIMLGLNIIQINRFQDRFSIVEKIKDNFDGIFYGISIIYNNSYLPNIMGLSIIGIFIYSIYTWVREYTQNSVYTLKMIPCNKFNLYLSKMVSSIVMIYGVLITQIIILFISKNIFNIMFRNIGIIPTSLFEDLSYLSTYYNVPTNMIDFIMIYGIGLVLKLSVLFTAIVFIISFKNKNKSFFIITIGLYVIILSKIMIYRNIGDFYSNLGAKYIGNIGVDIISGTFFIILLSYMSYKLINKKFYI
ncbi:ABC transporter permease [Faecalimicrobium sp. JNUCC 81]